MESNPLKHPPNIVPEKLKQRSHLEVLTPEEARIIRDVFSSCIAIWHEKVKPDVIILTATSATPYGYLIKRAWKKLLFQTRNNPFL